MPINDAQGQVIAATSQGSEQNSREQLSGAEIDTAVSGRMKVEVPLTIETVIERSNMMLAWQRVVENKGAAGVDIGLCIIRIFVATFRYPFRFQAPEESLHWGIVPAVSTTTHAPFYTVLA